MGVIVSKFGGSSVADANMFRRVRKIIESCPRRQYIVLSAPGKRFSEDSKITDLLNLSHTLFAQGLDGSEPLREVKARFEQIIRELNIGVCPDELLSGLETDVKRSADHAASRGEFLCAKLFALYADLPFFDASRLIHFDAKGRLQRDKTAESIRDMASRLPCAVIPGFYGSLPDGSIKTFSRGGSDITGALVAAALNASLYENWTDVDGLMSADPSVISEAVHHPAVSYRQMRLLSLAGAKVLHPYCVEPVSDSGIPTVLKNTFAPEKPGTYISDCVKRTVPCICTEDNCTAVSLSDLSKESQALLRGLKIPFLCTDDGSQIVILKSDSFLPGTAVTIVSIFGIDEALHDKAHNITHSIAAKSTDSGLIFAIRPKSVHSILIQLHKLLIMPEDSRIP